jgi:hypothetical protein
MQRLSRAVFEWPLPAEQIVAVFGALHHLLCLEIKLI